MRKLTALLLLIASLITLAVPALAVDYGTELENQPDKVYTQKFKDVPPDHWAFVYISEMVERGVVSGYPDGTFGPTNQVTRSEFAKLMVSAAGLRITNTGKTSFTDVYPDDWFAPYVEAAKDYLTGYAGGLYKPTMAALREDIAVALVKIKGYDISLADESILNMFTDVSSISQAARKYVAVAVERGLVSGFTDRTFRGQATLSRAEAAALLWRAFQYGSDNKLTDTGGVPAQPPETPPASPDTTTPPTDTPTQGEKPDALPYVIDTLVRADIKDYVSNNMGSTTISSEAYFMTSNGIDTIYYYLQADNTIYSVNTNTKGAKQVLSLETLNDTSNPFQTSRFVLSDICWDTYNSRLLVNGSSGLYEMTGDAVTLVTDEPFRGCIVGTLSNGDYIANSSSGPFILNGITYEQGTKICNYNYENVYQAIKTGNSIVFVKTNGYGGFGGLYTYDFSSLKAIETPSGSIRAGVSGNGYVVASKDTVVIYPTDGASIIVAPKDYEVIDSAAVDFNAAINKLFPMKDNSVVFYDTAANAFRILRESE